jgi:hypothetical protein
MSNGDSPDGFVFPPFVPPSAPRPAASRQAEPAAAPPPALPWEQEAPSSAVPPAPPAPAEEPRAEEGSLEDLPWLERPAPREEGPSPEAATPAEGEEAEVLPDWMTWDARAEADAEAEISSTPPLEGLEDLSVPDLGFEEEPPLPVEELSFDPFGGGLPPAEVAAAGTVEFEPEERHPFPPATAEDPFPEPAPWEAASEPAPFVADEEAVMAAEPDPFAAAEIAATEAQEPQEAGAASAAAEPLPADGSAFDEVAARLEEIARALRERPDELLSGRAADPLALLVTGYVAGYTQGRRSG